MKKEVGHVEMYEQRSRCDPVLLRVNSLMAGVQSGLGHLCLALGGAHWFHERGEEIASRAK